jgi:hypothetical protein
MTTTGYIEYGKYWVTPGIEKIYESCHYQEYLSKALKLNTHCIEDMDWNNLKAWELFVEDFCNPVTIEDYNEYIRSN